MSDGALIESAEIDTLRRVFKLIMALGGAGGHPATTADPFVVLRTGGLAATTRRDAGGLTTSVAHSPKLPGSALRVGAESASCQHRGSGVEVDGHRLGHRP